MYSRQVHNPGDQHELAVWQPWRVGPGAKNYRGLGDVNSVLASIVPDSSTFAISPTLLYAGLGLLGVALLMNLGGKASRRISSGRRKRAARKARISQAKAALQLARAT